MKHSIQSTVFDPAGFESTRLFASEDMECGVDVAEWSLCLKSQAPQPIHAVEEQKSRISATVFGTLEF